LGNIYAAQFFAQAERDEGRLGAGGRHQAHHTIIGNGGLNVLNLTGGLDLSGSETLTLQGTAADAFVINVPDAADFEMIGSSQIRVSGGLLPQNVLFNLLDTGTGYDVIGNRIDGVILSPFAEFGASGLIFGEIIASDVQLHSGASVTNTFVPIPPTAVLLGSGLLGLGLLGGRKHWFRRN
jgi:hypothetical protein